MINTYLQVPAVYYKESRDFQVLGRTYDIIFNYLKTNIDMIYHNQLDYSSDKKLLDLIALTLGFDSKHDYDLSQLYNICTVFVQLLKYKGTLYSIKLAVDTIQNSQGLSDSSLVQRNKENPYLIDIYITNKIFDLSLLKDILDYIIPAGISYALYSNTILTDNTYTTTIKSGVSSIEKNEAPTYYYKNIADIDPSLNIVPPYLNVVPSIKDVTNNNSLNMPGTIDNISVATLEVKENDAEGGN